VGGVNATLRQMQDFLAKEGVQPIDALYQPFDPNFHNAVLREETTEYPENTVVEELQKGYTLGERVLRPTMVKVSTGGE
jgi:molecular chaperone GrpE